jgi:hypothetical protein
MYNRLTRLCRKMPMSVCARGISFSSDDGGVFQKLVHIYCGKRMTGVSAQDKKRAVTGFFRLFIFHSGLFSTGVDNFVENVTHTLCAIHTGFLHRQPSAVHFTAP